MTGSTESGHSALVVGAGGGIGGALVEALAARPEVGRVFATSRSGEAPAAAGVTPLRLDLTDEGSVAKAFAEIAGATDRLHGVFVASGVLHGEGFGPERRLEQIDPAALAHVFALNATGPMLVAKHALPLLRHDEPAVFAALSARVGSIGDNRLGGWYAYRASKAALNQLIHTTAIEWRRRAPKALCVALHPGTVDTGLSKPFQRNVPPEKLFSPERAARQLLDVVDGLTPADSGSFFAWDGSPIPW
jgi:NAD(P)-dependent dehydrogenase (short-subunit alcohol dehydrogenase family)